MDSGAKRPREDADEAGDGGVEAPAGKRAKALDGEAVPRARKSRWGAKVEAEENAAGTAVAPAPPAPPAAAAGDRVDSDRVAAARAKLAEKKEELRRKQLDLKKKDLEAQVAAKLRKLEAGELFSSTAAVGTGPASALASPGEDTLLLNARMQQERLEKEQARKRALEQKAEEAAFFDPSLGAPRSVSDVARRRRAAGLHFVEEGKYSKLGEEMRMRSFLTSIGISKEAMASESVQANLALLAGNNLMVPLRLRTGQAAASLYHAEQVPAVEWWDKPLLAGPAYEAGDAPAIKAGAITRLVEHPVPIEPAHEPADVHLKPLMLTHRERKKLRRMTRLAAEKEKQLKVRLGLIKPPEPKYKLSNMMRVLGIEAAAEPTAIEAMVRKRQAERVAKHEATNESNKLTPEERIAKRQAAVATDLAAGLRCAVFRVEDLSHKQWKYKVRVNAEQLALNGCVAYMSGFAVVVAQGGAKALKKYKQLMLNRIKWADAQHLQDDQAVESAAAPMIARGENKCTLIWEGDIVKQNFFSFGFERNGTEAGARGFFAERGCEHYLDLAKSFVFDS